MKKTTKLLMLLIVALITAVSFSSCSKDDDKDNKKNNSEKAFIGAWELEGASSTRSLMLFKKDGTGQIVVLKYFFGKLLEWDIKDITWKADESILTTTYGAINEYKNYIMADDKNSFDWNWKSEKGTYICISTDEYQGYLNTVPLNKSVIGAWADDNNTDADKSFWIFYNDGICQNLTLSYLYGTLYDWVITGYKWSADDSSLKIESPFLTDNRGLTLSNKNKMMVFGSDNYTRIDEKTYNKYLNEANPIDFISAGGWKDSAGRTNQGWGDFTQPYLCFFNDGTLRAIIAWSHTDGTIYHHPNEFGYFQFNNARMSYDIGNGSSKGSSLYLMTSTGGLRFYDTDGYCFGSGDFEKIADTEISPLVENL